MKSEVDLKKFVGKQQGMSRKKNERNSVEKSSEYS
jgi:hypothetical protein